MGVVYRAHDPDLGRDVAIKVVTAGKDAGARILERFRREAQAAARLDHPNVVRVHHVGTERGVAYLVMDYITGETLEARLGRPLDHREAALIAATVARALQHAHERGIVHRDVKPSNLLVGEDGRVSLMDFGLAQDEVSAERLTKTGEMLGTIHYMPPEQVSSKPEGVGPAADVYSLGAVLFSSVAGRPPFSGGSAMNVMTAIVREPAPRLRSLAATAPAALEAIVSRCLEKEPADRYESAAALADDLDRFLAGEAVAGRLGAPTRLARSVRRSGRLIAATLGLVAVLAVGGLGLASFGRLGSERRASEAAQRAVDVLADGLPGLLPPESPDGIDRLRRRGDAVYLGDLAARLEGSIAALEGLDDGEDHGRSDLIASLRVARAVAIARAGETPAAVLAAVAAADEVADLAVGLVRAPPPRGRLERASLERLHHLGALVLAEAAADVGDRATAGRLADALAETGAPAPIRAEAILLGATLDVVASVEPDRVADRLGAAVALDARLGPRAAAIEAGVRAAAGDRRGAVNAAAAPGLSPRERRSIRADAFLVTGRADLALGELHRARRSRDPHLLARLIAVLLRCADEADALAASAELREIPADAPRAARAARSRLQADLAAAGGDRDGALEREDEAARLVVAPSVPGLIARTGRLADAALDRARVAGEATELARAVALVALLERRTGPDLDRMAALAAAAVRTGDLHQARGAVDTVAGRVSRGQTIAAAARRLAVRAALAAERPARALELLDASIPAEPDAAADDLLVPRLRALVALGRTDDADALLARLPEAPALAGPDDLVGQVRLAERAVAVGELLRETAGAAQDVADRANAAGDAMEAIRAIRGARVKDAFRTGLADAASRRRVGELALRDGTPLETVYVKAIAEAVLTGEIVPDVDDAGSLLLNGVTLIQVGDQALGSLDRAPGGEGGSADLPEQYAQAERLLQAVIAEAPSCAIAFAQRGWARTQLGRPDAARADVVRGRRLSPTGYHFVVFEAGVEALHGEADEALELFAEAIGRGWSSFGAFTEFKAIEKAMVTVRADPRFDDIRILSFVNFQKDPLLDRLDGERPRSAAAAAANRILAGVARMRANDLVRAHTDLTRAVQLFEQAGRSPPGQLLAALGTCARRAGRPDVAIPALERALAAMPVPPAPPASYRNDGYAARVFETRRPFDDRLHVARQLGVALAADGRTEEAFEIILREAGRSIDHTILSGMLVED